MGKSDKSNLIFLVEPSDRRNIILLEKLRQNYDAAEFDFNNDFLNAENRSNKKTVVVFSLARKFTLEEAAKLPVNSTVAGGAQAEEFLNALEKRGVTYVNLIKNESYAVKNAMLTAEAALALVIGNSEKSIFENNILILGCGRVGKAVSLILRKLGLNVAIATFDKAEFYACPLYADKSFFKYGFCAALNDYDVIINTVPARMLDNAVLEKVRPEAAIIELASVNCLDTENINKYSFKYIPAPALPAKYSAETAADIMLEALLEFTIYN